MGEKLVIEAEVRNLPKIRGFVEAWATAQQAKRNAVDDLILAVDESATNIMVHGYKGQPGVIEISLDLDHDEMVVQIEDQARLFDPTNIPPPDLTLPLELRAEGGLGVYLARKFVDMYSYRVTEDGRNELTLRKRLHSD
jgi:serine/threonine-protein kinase RsbW